jgi:hypothetical protein
LLRCIPPFFFFFFPCRYELAQLPPDDFSGREELLAEGTRLVQKKKQKKTQKIKEQCRQHEGEGGGDEGGRGGRGGQEEDVEEGEDGGLGAAKRAEGEGGGDVGGGGGKEEDGGGEEVGRQMRGRGRGGGHEEVREREEGRGEEVGERGERGGQEVREREEGGGQEVGEREEGGRVKVAVCVSGAMRGLRAELLYETLLSKLDWYGLFFFVFFCLFCLFFGTQGIASRASPWDTAEQVGLVWPVFCACVFSSFFLRFLRCCFFRAGNCKQELLYETLLSKGEGYDLFVYSPEDICIHICIYKYICILYIYIYIIKVI